MNQTQPRPQAQSPEAQSPSSTIPDEKLTAAAAALGEVTSIRQSYERKIAEVPQPDKQRVTDEANNALKKAVTDQGLSVDEYNTILRTAQNDPTIRQKLAQRIPRSAQ
jgi:malic enzyme